MTKLHYNWKYPFLRPTEKAVVVRYKQKFQAGSSTAAPAPAPAAAAVATD